MIVLYRNYFIMYTPKNFLNYNFGYDTFMDYNGTRFI